MENNQENPSGLVAIQWFLRLGGTLLIFLGLFIPLIPFIWEAELIAYAIFIPIALVPIIFGSLYFLSASGLGKRKKWAKNLTLILCFLNILIGIGTIIFLGDFFRVITSLAITVFIIYYLLKNKELFN